MLATQHEKKKISKWLIYLTRDRITFLTEDCVLIIIFFFYFRLRVANFSQLKSIRAFIQYCLRVVSHNIDGSTNPPLMQL